ncbi:MAG: hypothetical protein R2867_23470 [Caldilineaceae bacterium]
MYDYAMFEAARARHNDIQRAMEKARQGIEVHGTAPQVDSVLPGWVNQLLHAAPFRRHPDANGDKAQPSKEETYL